jgi:hypothetical protein
MPYAFLNPQSEFICLLLAACCLLALSLSKGCPLPSASCQLLLCHEFCRIVEKIWGIMLFMIDRITTLEG